MQKSLSTVNLPHSASGQSLIETIVAIFVLTTALTAGLGLTIYVFSSSATSQNEIIASNLAREGIEVIRMMRDSNWLAGDASSDVTYNLQPCADIQNRLCFPKALIGPTYALDGTFVNFRVAFNVSGAWTKEDIHDYDLYLQADGTYTSTPNGASVFARMINLTKNTTAPYTAGNPEFIIKSVVAWRGKNCPSFDTTQNLIAIVSACKIVVEEHVTNWKDYK